MRNTAPQMLQFIDYYGVTGFSDIHKLDTNSEKLLLKLFKIAEPIVNIENSQKKQFYFYLPKGTYEDFKELCNETDEEILRSWYNNESAMWFDCTLLVDDFNSKENPFYGVWINHSLVLTMNDRHAIEWPETDASDLCECLIEVVEDVVKKLKEDTYNNWVLENISYEMKLGTVSRKDYWRAFPEEKKKYNVSEEEFNLLKQEKIGNITPKTARQYYEAVAVCYNAIGFKKLSGRFEDIEEEHRRYNGVTPKELYYRYADGRDEGLSEVPLDSEEDFRKWLNKEESYTVWGGHPFEIIFSFTGTKSIHLYMFEGKLKLSAGDYPANMQALKMYIALIKNDYEVEFGNKDGILLRLEEKDRIGFKSYYSSEKFIEDDLILDIEELTEEKYEKLKDKIIWQPLRKTFLKEGVL